MAHSNHFLNFAKGQHRTSAFQPSIKPFATHLLEGDVTGESAEPRHNQQLIENRLQRKDPVVFIERKLPIEHQRKDLEWKMTVRILSTQNEKRNIAQVKKL